MKWIKIFNGSEFWEKNVKGKKKAYYVDLHFTERKQIDPTAWGQTHDRKNLNLKSSYQSRDLTWSNVLTSYGGVASSKYENIAAFPVTKSRATNVVVEIVKGKYVLPSISFLLSLITSAVTIAEFEFRLTEFSLQARRAVGWVKMAQWPIHHLHRGL